MTGERKLSRVGLGTKHDSVPGCWPMNTVPGAVRVCLPATRQIVSGTIR